jgi:hypothetical protein
MSQSRDAKKDPRPGDAYLYYSEATVSHFRLFIDVVGARNVWYDVVGRYGGVDTRKMSKDEFIAWVAGMEVINVAAE